MKALIRTLLLFLAAAAFLGCQKEASLDSVTAPIAERFGLSFDFAEVPDIVARHGLPPFG